MPPTKQLILYLTILFFFLLLMSNFIYSSNQTKHKKVPQEKVLVSNKETAIKIAAAVWLNLYGDKIYNRKPFHAKFLKGKIWQVSGTLPKGYDGGVPFVEIRKSDSKILKVGHGK